jgi:hypothetical protein
MDARLYYLAPTTKPVLHAESCGGAYGISSRFRVILSRFYLVQLVLKNCSFKHTVQFLAIDHRSGGCRGFRASHQHIEDCLPIPLAAFILVPDIKTSYPGQISGFTSTSSRLDPTMTTPPSKQANIKSYPHVAGITDAKISDILVKGLVTTLAMIGLYVLLWLIILSIQRWNSIDHRNGRAEERAKARVPAGVTRNVEDATLGDYSRRSSETRWSSVRMTSMLSSFSVDERTSLRI